MNWKLLPKFRGQTSWGLMTSVRRAILAEPKRVFMGNWLTINEDEIIGKAPACGTQGCIAGWMYAETAPKDELVGSNAVFHVEHTAYSLLPEGPTRIDAYDLFNGHGAYQFPYYLYNGDAHARRRYAEKVVKNIDKFMAKHKAALKAHRINRAEVYGR